MGDDGAGVNEAGVNEASMNEAGDDETDVARSGSSRRYLIAIAAFVALCGALIASSTQSRVGDAGEYTAMAWQFAHLRPPALSADDIADLDRHYASLGDRMTGYEGSVARHEPLLAGGRYDQLHFWVYPLAAAPLVAVADVLNVPDTYAFAVLNVALLTCAFAVTLRRVGWLAACLLCASPVLWWIDKPTGEVLVFSLLVMALLWLRDHPLRGLMCVAILSAHNLSLSFLAAAYGITALLIHGRPLIASTRARLIALGAVAVAAAHPIYYLLRLGAVSPSLLVQDQSTRIPTITRLVTPIVDPYVGLLVWWPMLAVAAGVMGLRRAWHRQPRRRSVREWAVVWSPFALAFIVLYAQAQNREPASGGTFAMSRYAVWIAPFAVFAFTAVPRRPPNRPRYLGAGTALAAVAASLAMSISVARPDHPDVWFTVQPSRVSERLYAQAPWIWNSPPQVFVTRELRRYGSIEPAANWACTKLLAVNGTWPPTCPAPTDPPAECLSSPFCYANRSGREYSFVTVDEWG